MSLYSPRQVVYRFEMLRTLQEPLPADYRKGAIWVEPRLVAQVEFKTWTADRLLRAASFQGLLREDKPTAEVTREQPAR